VVERKSSLAAMPTRDRVVVYPIDTDIISGYIVGVMNKLSHITVSKKILGGVPTIRGTRVPVDTIASFILHKKTSEIYKEFPGITRAQVGDVRKFMIQRATS